MARISCLMMKVLVAFLLIASCVSVVMVRAAVPCRNFIDCFGKIPCDIPKIIYCENNECVCDDLEKPLPAKSRY
ncbi:hypothetical protein NC652_035831 [Populus alba x Populus x berolinensis]|nr:hypothetical protein NC652_035831 [Populus alba x Populus x berolinensis]